jgi:hypothetical protein
VLYVDVPGIEDGHSEVDEGEIGFGIQRNASMNFDQESS